MCLIDICLLSESFVTIALLFFELLKKVPGCGQKNVYVYYTLFLLSTLYTFRYVG